MHRQCHAFYAVTLVVFSSLCMTLGQGQGDENRKLTIRGRICGYSRASRLRMLSGNSRTPSHDAFLFLVKNGDSGLANGKYIKIQYKPSKNTSELPVDFFEDSKERLIIGQRDESCDEPWRSFVIGNKFEGVSPKETDRFPNLQLFAGYKDIRLPETGNAPCYSFRGGDNEFTSR
jgi:hypothetical protein